MPKQKWSKLPKPKITRLQKKKIAGMANAARDGDTRDNTKNTSIATMSTKKNTTIAAAQEGTTAAERETPLKRRAENISMMDSSNSESISDSDSDSSLVSEDNDGSSNKNKDNSEKIKETKKTMEGRQKKKKNVNQTVKRLTEIANKNPDLLEKILKMVSHTSKKGENYKEDAAKTTDTVPLKTVRSGDSVDKVSMLSYGSIHSMKTGTMKLLKTHIDTIEGQVRAYVKKECGSADGWDKEGRRMFTKLCKKVQTLREDPETGKNLEKMMLERFNSESNPTKTVSKDGGTVASSLAEEENEDDNYIDPALMQLLDKMEEV
eukprot:jgi/Psemu1/37025/gm1.37025_g